MAAGSLHMRNPSHKMVCNGKQSFERASEALLNFNFLKMLCYECNMPEKNAASCLNHCNCFSHYCASPSLLSSSSNGWFLESAADRDVILLKVMKTQLQLNIKTWKQRYHQYEVELLLCYRVAHKTTRPASILLSLLSPCHFFFAIPGS